MAFVATDGARRDSQLDFSPEFMHRFHWISQVFSHPSQSSYSSFSDDLLLWIRLLLSFLFPRLSQHTHPGMTYILSFIPSRISQN